MEPLDPGPPPTGRDEIRRREALGFGLLGLVGMGVASSLLAADAARTAGPHRAGRHPAAARGGAAHLSPSPAPASSPPTPSPSPEPAAPVSVWTRAASKISDIQADAPADAVALTIDDGPHPEWTPRVLDLLAKHDVTATFFLIGEQIRDNEEVVQMMVKAGHAVANHTWTHPIRIARLSRSQVDREIGKTHQTIVEVTGRSPTVFRSPGGNWSPAVYASVAEQGMIPVQWAVDPRDWSRPGTGHIVDELSRCSPGDILLCHDGGGDRSETLRALRVVIPRIKSRGLDFVAL